MDAFLNVKKYKSTTKTWSGNGFSNYDTKSRSCERKIYKSDYINIFNRNFCHMLKNSKANQEKNLQLKLHKKH